MKFFAVCGQLQEEDWKSIFIRVYKASINLKSVSQNYLPFFFLFWESLIEKKCSLNNMHKQYLDYDKLMKQYKNICRLYGNIVFWIYFHHNIGRMTRTCTKHLCF